MQRPGFVIRLGLLAWVGVSVAQSALASSGAWTLFLQGQWKILEQGFTPESEQLLQDVISADPKSWYARYVLAQQYVASGAFIRAKTVLKDAIRKHPSNEDLLLLLAKVHVMLNEHDLAIEEFRRILAQNPQHEEAMAQLALVYAAQKKYDDALKLLTQIEAFGENLPLVHLYQARLYLEMGKEDSAIAALEKAVMYRSDSAEIWLLLGILREGRGQMETARAAYEKYSELRPQDAEILKKLVDIYITSQTYEKALPLLEVLHDLEPQNTQVTLKLALLYVEFKAFSEARTTLEVLARDPVEGKIANYYLGVVCQITGDIQCSERAYNLVPAKSPYYKEAVLQLALIWLTKRAHDRVIRLMETASNQGYRDENVVLMWSAAYELKGNVKEAIAVLDGFLKEHPKNIKVLYAKANTLYKGTHRGEGVATIQYLLSIEPNHIHGLNFLGYHFLTVEKKYSEAFGYIKRAFDLAPSDPYVLDSMGWYYVVQNQPKQGLTYLEKAFEGKSDNLDILEHLVRAYLTIGNTVSAQEALKKASSEHSAVWTDKEKAIFYGLERLRTGTERLPAGSP